MKKKVALTAAAVALVGTLAVGGTLAWFTDTETATNTITTGHVDNEIWEASSSELVPDNSKYSKQDDAGITFTQKFVPMAKVGKHVKVKINEDSEKAYVRVKVSLPSELTNPGEGIAPAVIAYNTVDWTKLGDYYYYNYPVGPGEFTSDLFSSITLPNWGNNMIERKGTEALNIGIQADSIQADNLAELPNDEDDVITAEDIADAFGTGAVDDYEK